MGELCRRCDAGHQNHRPAAAGDTADELKSNLALFGVGPRGATCCGGNLVTGVTPSGQPWRSRYEEGICCTDVWAAFAYGLRYASDGIADIVWMNWKILCLLHFALRLYYACSKIVMASSAG